MFFVILASLIAIMSKNFLVQLRRWSSSFLLRKLVCLYGVGVAIYFCEVFQYYAFHHCHNI